MKLRLFRHLWGIGRPWEEVFPRIKAAGYEGIETGLQAPADERRFMTLMREYGFAYIAQIVTSGNSVDEHLKSFAGHLQQATTLNPLFVNAHSGQDSFSEEESHSFFAQALRLEEEPV